MVIISSQSYKMASRVLALLTFLHSYDCYVNEYSLLDSNHTGMIIIANYRNNLSAPVLKQHAR